ncbi:hypothetical protein [Nocardia pneumoniae]|nr:hypothetical protein [Nocardia pneumoniae]
MLSAAMPAEVVADADVPSRLGLDDPAARTMRGSAELPAGLPLLI